MPLGTCVWCARRRLVELQTWRSPRSGEQLCGNVCGHCFFGTGAYDDCRTCKMKRQKFAAESDTGVHVLGRADALELLQRQYRPRGKARE